MNLISALFKILFCSSKQDKRTYETLNTSKPNIEPAIPKSEVKTEAQILGEIGEQKVLHKLGFLTQYGKFLTNLYIPKTDGSTTEVDIVYICTHGLFVIESKNYRGWIFGSQENKKWTQVIYSKGYKNYYQFYNPILQNRTHIKCIKDYLKRYDISCFNVIVFSGNCELKKIELYDSDIFVTRIENLDDVIKHLITNSKSAITPQECVDIYKRLRICANASDNVKQKHIEMLTEFIH